MKRDVAHTTSKRVLTEKLPGTSVDVFPNGYVGRQILRWKDALRQLGAQRGGAGERQLRMDEQLKKEKWRQRGGEG